MSLAANDAFSLGLAHDGPRRRSSTRSPSPISSIGRFSQSPPGKGIKNIRRQVIRRLSNLQPVSVQATDNVQHHDLRRHPSNDMNHVKPPDRPINLVRDWEIPRKAMHSSIGFLTIYLYASHGSPRAVVLALCTALAIIIPADLFRFRSFKFARIYERYLGFLMRESEKHTWNGVIWYILGVVFSLSAYPLDIAVVSILILAWADTAASTIGRLFGTYTPRLPPRLPLLRIPLAPRKSVAGFLAASVTGACIAFCFWKYIAPWRPADLSWTWDGGMRRTMFSGSDWLRSHLFNLGFPGLETGGWMGLGAIAVVAGLVAGLAEAMDLSLDDNLTLPVISGGCLLGFFKLSGLFSSRLPSLAQT